MEEKLTARLFGLQKKLLGISIYNPENGRALFRCSVEFESLLSLLLKTGHRDFLIISQDYNKETQKDCLLCCEFNDEHNRCDAFYAGLHKMDFCLKESLRILAAKL